MRRQKNTFAVRVYGETVHECAREDAAWGAYDGELCAACCDCGVVLKGAAA
jgi:hypothetical protein